MKPGVDCHPVLPIPPGGGTFEEIYRQWFRSVCTWIRAMGGPEADRDDIAQDVFLVVRRRLVDFDGENLAGWLYRITQRQVRDFRRRAWVRHLFSSPDPGEGDPPDHGTASPATLLEQKEDERTLHAILGKLHESRRLTFVLYEIEGLSGEEIARIQSIPLNTVWSRLHQARRDFFALVAKHDRSRQAAEARRSATPQHEGRRGP